MRSWKEALAWLRENNTAQEIGFDPDGMCLKIARSARDIAARFLTAKQAQDATPREHRVYRVADLRKGMVLYIDDPNDSNTAGHIVTMMGRVRNANVNDLHDVLVKTNSVKANELVTVRADYFTHHWGDQFQFGATILNGVELDVPAKKDQSRPVATERVENFWESRNEWDVKILDRVVASGRPGLKTKIRSLDGAVKLLPDDLKDGKVDRFKQIYKEHRVLKMDLLNEYVREHPNATRVIAIRGRIRNIIKALPRR